MRTWWSSLALVCILAGTTGDPAMAQGAAPQTQPTAGLDEVGRYGVFEIVLTSDERFTDPFVDVVAGATFTSPTGRTVQVPGFYDGEGRWMVRFAPDELGTWSYAARLTGGRPVARDGRFGCVASDNPGFVRVSKRNPYRFEFADGRPFYPIGIHLCNALHPEHDGPTPDGQWRAVDMETWCRDFQGAVNLHRLQLGLGDRTGCAFPVLKGIADGRVEYDLEMARQLDEMYRTHARHGFRQILILFQDMSLWGNPSTPFGAGRDVEHYKSLKAANLPLQEQYIRYIVARYGAFVDIWEIYNEDGYSPDDYLAHLAKVIRDADPYDHLITTTYERPTQPWCDLVTPHEYMGIPAREVDGYLAKEFARFKSFGKPVQYTEFGNQGILSNVDPVKWRISTWTAFLNECHLLFWGMSGRKTEPGLPRGNANAYIGPESRAYFRILNDFVRDLPVDLRPVASGYTDQQHLRHYALGNGRIALIYVHHFSDHEKPYTLEDTFFLATGPGRHRFRWIDPATGKTVQEGEVETKGLYATIQLPPVKVDLAGRFERVE